MLVQKDTFYITRESLERLGVDPDYVIHVIESMGIADVSAVHVTAHQLLKKTRVPS